MAQTRGRSREGKIDQVAVAIAAVGAIAMVTASCHKVGTSSAVAGLPIVLRVGVSQLSATNPMGGLRQLAQNISLESLGRIGEDGRMLPALADRWKLSDNGRLLTLVLRDHVKFQDGSPLDADAVATLVPSALRSFLGPVAEDIVRIGTHGTSVDVLFRGASPFLTESLEAQVVKPDSGVGTGPFVMVPNSTTEMRANTDHYLGPPEIASIHVESYPSVRSAWAEMLRDRLDMLYEVGSEALGSMENSSRISVFTFTRRYQHVVVLNSDVPVLRSREIRQTLNKAVDRKALIRDALAGYGVASSGPVSPKYWALPKEPPTIPFDRENAVRTLAKTFGPQKSPSFRFTCLVPSDAVSERLALELKRQLQAVGISMDLEAAPQEEIVRRVPQKRYEAALIELISGPTLLRPYLVWRSHSPLNWGGFGNTTVDAALDRVRHAGSDDALRQSIVGLQQAFMDDPPAIFLAWSVRARAVSKRFVVPSVESGRDVLSTLRLWKPATADLRASRN